MAARMDNALAFITNPSNRGIYVFLEDIDAPLHSTMDWCAVLDILEYPGAAEGRATYHHSIHAIFVEALAGTFRSLCSA